MKISRISSLLTPLTSAPLMCTRSSCGRLRIEIIARLSMLRVLRGSSSRPHTAPQQYSVTSSWNGFANFQSLVVCLLVHGVPLTFLAVGMTSDVTRSQACSHAFVLCAPAVWLSPSRRCLIAAAVLG